MFSFAKLPANVVQVKRSDIQAMLKLLQQWEGERNGRIIHAYMHLISDHQSKQLI
jgi:hypothetical protein